MVPPASPTATSAPEDSYGLLPTTTEQQHRYLAPRTDEQHLAPLAPIAKPPWTDREASLDRPRSLLAPLHRPRSPPWTDGEPPWTDREVCLHPSHLSAKQLTPVE